MAKTILIVDDNEDTLEVTESCLRGHDYDVVTVSDGPRALEYVRRQLPDCILLDVMMPCMSGLEVLSCLRKHPPTAAIPVILVTARSHDDDLLSGYKEGADYYITKPFSAEQLLYGIRMVLGAATTSRAKQEQ